MVNVAGRFVGGYRVIGLSILCLLWGVQGVPTAAEEAAVGGEFLLQPTSGDVKDRRVDIAAGEIPVVAFLRFLGDYRGLPIILGGATPADVEQPIAIAAPIPAAGDEIVLAILDANGWSVTEESLKSGKKVLRAERARKSTLTRTRLTPPPRTRPGAGSPVAWPSPDEGPAKPQPLVLRRIGAKLERVAAPDSPLALEGVEPDDEVTVVVSLEHVDSKTALMPVQQLLVGRNSPEPLEVSLVQNTQTVVFAGTAAVIDRALTILHAIDVPRPVGPIETPLPEAETRVFELRHADAGATVQMLQALLPGGSGAIPSSRSTRTRSVVSPSGRASTSTLRLLADVRTQTIILRTAEPRDIEAVEKLLEVLDAPAKVDRSTVRVIRLQHASTEFVVSVMERLLEGSVPTTRVDLIPHEETRSLIVQAPAETHARIDEILKVLDVPPPPAAETDPFPVAPPAAEPAPAPAEEGSAASPETVKAAPAANS